MMFAKAICFCHSVCALIPGGVARVLVLAYSLSASGLSLAVSGAAQPLDAQELSRSVQASLAQTQCCDFEFAPAIGNDQPGRFTVAPMYASERGSWPFEPFTHSGLFAVIAGYQQNHPRALSLTSGHYSLSELSVAVNDDKILRPHKDGYLLSYPLQILPGASLLIEDTTLYMAAYSGAALINLGDLELRSARLTVWQGDRAPSAVANYRPFVVGWAGSRTWLIGSELDRLGYNAHLSRGVAILRSKGQPATDAAPELLVRDSRFLQLTTALAMTQARAVIEHSVFDQSRHYGLDITDSRVAVTGSQFNTATVNSLIRASGSSEVTVSNCRLDGAAKHGVEWLEPSGYLSVRDSVITHSGAHGVSVHGGEFAAAGPLVLQNNLMTANTKSGVNSENFATVILQGNIFSGNGDYAVSYRNDQAQPAGALMLELNRFMRSSQPALRTQNLSRLALLNNTFSLDSVNQKLVAGELEPYQSAIAQQLFKYRCYTEVVRADGGSDLTVLSARQPQSHQCVN